MRRVGVSIVGLGAASEPHAKSLAELAGIVDVIWAASRTAARTRAFTARFPFPVTSDIERAIHDPAVEAVLVLTPAHTHLEIAERCLAAGKHVLVEKPLDASVERAERLVDLAQKAKLRLGVVMQHRFRSGAMRLREVLESGRLGEIQFASVTVPWWRPQTYYVGGRGTLARDGGGVLITQAIHAIDLFRSLVGVSDVVAADVVTTAVHDIETEDYVAALLRLGNGRPGLLSATTALYPGRAEQIEVTGTAGTALLAGGALRVALLNGEEETVAGETATGSGANIMDFPNDAHRRLIEAFVLAMRDDTDAFVSGDEALETQRLIDRIVAFRNSQNGRNRRAAGTKDWKR
jgi:predicted dehydrogenase